MWHFTWNIRNIMCTIRKLYDLSYECLCPKFLCVILENFCSWESKGKHKKVRESSESKSLNWMVRIKLHDCIFIVVDVVKDLLGQL